MRILRVPVVIAVLLGLVVGQIAPILTPSVAHAQTVTAQPAPVVPAVISAPQADPEIVYTPADLADGAAVTIGVDPAEIPAGGTITVSGQGAQNGTQVRLAVVTDGKTLGIQDVDVDGNGAYTAQIPIGATYPPGKVHLCALGLGLQNAEVACTDLVISAPPDGSVAGQLPLSAAEANVAALDARINLMNAAGSVLYSAPIGANGRFSLPDIAPGVYLYAVAGTVPSLAEMGAVTVEPLKESVLKFAVQKQCGIVSQLRPTTALTVNPSRVEFVRKSKFNGLFRTYVDERRPFGLYVSGVRNDVTFTAAPQATGAVEKVIFEFFGVNGQVIQRLEDTSAPYAAVFDVGRLPASQGGTHPFVSATPVVGGKNQCPSLYDIEVMGDPMSTTYMQPLPNSRTVWDGASRTYRFEGIIPYIPDVLPAKNTLADVPLLGKIRNEFNTGLAIKGYFDLEGQARIFLAEVFADAVLLSLPILAPGELRENVTPPGLGQVAFDIRNPAHMAIPFGPLELYQRDIISVPFTKILVFTYFGIVNAYISGGLNFGVGLYLEGEVRPLVPAVDTTLSGVGSFRAELGLSIDVLFGLVEGGAGLGGEICAGIPLRVVVAAAPDVFFDDPFVGGRLYFVAWASAIWGLVKTRTTATLVNFGRGCPERAALTAAEEDPPVPDVFASPVSVASPDGRVLAAYVENTAAPGATPQVQILARIQDPNTGEWSAAQALSNVAHSSQSPTVAFVGPNLTPLVAWAEYTLTAAEAAAIGENDAEKDAAEHMRHLEIFYSLWSDGWGDPIRLTDDALPDGLPEAAGSQSPSILAWTTDTDGDAGTRGDQRIAVSTYDAGLQRFAAPTLLGYTDAEHPDGVLNNDVAVALDDGGNAYVAWVYDLDADLTTGDDRRLEVVKGLSADWVSLNPQPLPPRVDSPTLTVTPNGVQLAFLVREATPDGEVSVLGSNGMLWTALYNANQTWTTGAVLDAADAPVYAEQPDLEHLGAEALLVFRRFGNTKNTALGQISLVQIEEAGPPSPPLYLTNKPAQQWLPALAINPVSGQAVILHSSLTGSAAAAQDALAAAPEALPAQVGGLLQTTADPVVYLTLENTADPALDPLQVSVPAPAPGATIQLTTTVRNVGRGTATEMRLDLYRGTPDTGTFLDELAVPSDLAFNQTAAVTFDIVVPADLAPTGLLSLTVQLVTTGENVTTANDTAGLTLGGLTAPSRVEFLGESAEYTGTLDIAWSGNTGEYVTGYRVYRSDAASGPWALVGETAVPVFTDTAVVYDQSYCYAVQAYNAQGALSPQAPASCDILPSPPAADRPNLYMPALRRP